MCRVTTGLTIRLYRHLADMGLDDAPPIATADYCVDGDVTILLATIMVVVERDFIHPRDQWVKADISASIWSAGCGSRSRFKLIRMSRVGLQG